MRCRPRPLAPTMSASDSAVVRTSCATWPQAGLRATHAQPRTKRPLQLTREPPPASVGAPPRLHRATPVRTRSPCAAELCRARRARSQNPGTKGRTSDNGRRRSRPATLTPSGLAHCHATSADSPSLTVIFGAYDQPRTEFPEEALERLAQSIRDKGQLSPIRVRWSARRAHLASVSLSQDFGQVFVIPTSAEAALTDTMLVCPMMF